MLLKLFFLTLVTTVTVWSQSVAEKGNLGDLIKDVFGNNNPPTPKDVAQEDKVRRDVHNLTYIILKPS